MTSRKRVSKRLSKAKSSKNEVHDGKGILILIPMPEAPQSLPYSPYPSDTNQREHPALH